MKHQPPSRIEGIGVLLLMVGLGRFIAISENPPRLIALLLDGLGLCFIAGISLTVIGWVRRRRAASTRSA